MSDEACPEPVEGVDVIQWPCGALPRNERGIGLFEGSNLALLIATTVLTRFGHHASKEPDA